MRYPYACIVRRAPSERCCFGEPDPSAYQPSEEVVDTLFHLEFPDDLLPGEFELRLIVYNMSTVEIDVWEPELVLARLHWGELQ